MLLTECPANSKEHGVVVHLLHAVVLEEDARVSVHVGPGVLDLAGVNENGGHNGVQLKER